uniref:Uncharacterized protein n=1 Tax=Octactis speculum TaxID=3111310 RepID=A0A7S2AMA3_9STRA|mmetsp:Transcript_1250/g.1520  ORF Transcript_1250/g.1520 Transcript_1250/m.1520 type:complete len:155 (+) Transcript_1250:226-690(+)
MSVLQFFFPCIYLQLALVILDMAHFGLGRAVNDYTKMVVTNIHVIYAKDKTSVGYWVTDLYSWTGKTLRFDNSGEAIKKFPYLVLGCDAGQRMVDLLAKRNPSPVKQLFVQPLRKVDENDPIYWSNVPWTASSLNVFRPVVTALSDVEKKPLVN